MFKFNRLKLEPICYWTNNIMLSLDPQASTTHEIFSEHRLKCIVCTHIYVYVFSREIKVLSCGTEINESFRRK